MEETNVTKTQGYAEIENLIEGAKHIAIVPSKISSTDAFSAAVGLYYMLLDKDKQLSFIYPGKLPELFQDFKLMDPSQIKSDTSSRSLMVSIDYSETPAASVRYSNDDNVLHLEISPISREFDLNRVKASVAGFDFDLVITIGAQSVDDLGYIYKNLEKEFKSAKIINIDNSSMNGKFGSINLVDTTKDNLSLLMFDLAAGLGMAPDVKAAKSLLIGMTYREPAN
jgi:nanoRNase/pAp phosphatase (c-di-AMP/oligoRNAs hydrolase)